MASETMHDYSAEDVRQILNGGADGFVFRGPDVSDPLGELLTVGLPQSSNGTMNETGIPLVEVSEVLLPEGQQIQL